MKKCLDCGRLFTGGKRKVLTTVCGEVIEEYDYVCPACGSRKIGMGLEDVLSELGYPGNGRERRRAYADYGI